MIALFWKKITTVVCITIAAKYLKKRKKVMMGILINRSIPDKTLHIICLVPSSGLVKVSMELVGTMDGNFLNWIDTYMHIKNCEVTM